MSQVQLKQALRLRYRQWMRENITTEIALANGHKILEKLKAEKTERGERLKVSVFVSKCPEISTFPLIKWLFEVGAEVHLPAWHAEEMWMCAIETQSQFENLISSTPNGRIPMPSEGRVEVQVKFQE